MKQRHVTALACLAIAVAMATVAWYGVGTEGILDDIADDAGFVTTVFFVGEVIGYVLTLRSRNRWAGPLVQLAGAAVPLSAVREANVGALVADASTLWLATLLLPALLLLEVPERISGRVTRVVVIGGLAVSAALAKPITQTAGIHASQTWWYVKFPFAIDPDARRLLAVHTSVVLLTLSAVTIALVRHHRRLPPVARALVRPVLFAGVAWTLVTMAAQVTRTLDPGWALRDTYDGYTAAGAMVLHIAPLVAWAGLLATIAWTAVIAPRLAAATAVAADVETYLRRALADPSAKVAYRGPDGRWLDQRGEVVNLSTDAERAVIEIERDGVVLGALELDAAVASQPRVVDLVGAAAGLAIETSQFATLARARVEDARRLTARLVTSADDARRSLTRALDGGPLRELDDLLSTSPLDWGDAASRLEAVAADVRRLSHGVFPASLTEHGLTTALPNADVATSRRYPPSVEVTAYLAAYNDSAPHLREANGDLVVELTAPCIDDVVADRVSVLGGTIEGSKIAIPIGVNA